MTSQTAIPPVQTAATGRGYFWGAIGVFLVGLGALVIQFGVVKQLFVPWYMPATATIAAVLLVCAIAQRWTVARIIVLVLMTAVAGLEWLILTTLIKLPDYEGPARAGAKLPPFQTLRADGRTFTDKDLHDGTSRVLVFFRGRW